MNTKAVKSKDHNRRAKAKPSFFSFCKARRDSRLGSEYSKEPFVKVLIKCFLSHEPFCGTEWNNDRNNR